MANPRRQPSLEQRHREMLDAARKRELEELGKPEIDEMIAVQDRLAYKIESNTRAWMEVYGQTTVDQMLARELVVLEATKWFLQLVRANEKAIKRVLQDKED